MGGGGAPGQPLPGWAVGLPAELAPLLRLGETAVIGRVFAGRLLLDLRCVPEEQDAQVAFAVAQARERLD